MALDGVTPHATHTTAAAIVVVCPERFRASVSIATATLTPKTCEEGNAAVKALFISRGKMRFCSGATPNPGPGEVRHWWMSSLGDART